ncbi:MAG: hypothetical protein RLZZ604_915, partial [Pseudomonadota bacterium]
MSYSTDLGLYIDGSWRRGEGRDTHLVINPATGDTLAELPLATAADLDEREKGLRPFSVARGGRTDQDQWRHGCGQTRGKPGGLRRVEGRRVGAHENPRRRGTHLRRHRQLHSSQ